MNSFRTPKLLLVAVGLTFCVGVLLLVSGEKDASIASVSNFHECVAAGYGIQTEMRDGNTSTDSCVTPAGIKFEAQRAETSSTAGIDPSSLGCVRAGSTGELCVEKIFLESTPVLAVQNENTCFRNAICARQLNGHCGWTQMPVVRQCLSQLSAAAESIQ